MGPTYIVNWPGREKSRHFHIIPKASWLSYTCIMDGVSSYRPIVFVQFETAFCGTFRESDSRLRERRHFLQLRRDRKRRIAA